MSFLQWERLNSFTLVHVPVVHAVHPGISPWTGGKGFRGRWSAKTPTIPSPVFSQQVTKATSVSFISKTICSYSYGIGNGTTPRMRCKALVQHQHRELWGCIGMFCCGWISAICKQRRKEHPHCHLCSNFPLISWAGGAKQHISSGCNGDNWNSLLSGELTLWERLNK